MYYTNYASYLFFFIYLSYYIKVFIHACDTLLLSLLSFAFLLHCLFLSLLERLSLREHNKPLAFLLSSFLTFLVSALDFFTLWTNDPLSTRAQ